ncbi:MAG: MmcQ/YjbR family DNA-binding protein [Myxococcales bacterium]|nr:MmcQ/YjbR family DNA-binding protein [Myxococcales bacterium]
MARTKAAPPARPRAKAAPTAPKAPTAAKTPTARTPAKAQPAKAQPAKAQPAKAQPAKAQRAKAQRAKAQRAKAQRAKAQPAKAQRAKAQRAKAQRAKAQRAKAQSTHASTHPPKLRSPATLALIDQLRTICLALPDATEQVAWAEPTWRIGGKIFAMCDTYHHGSAHLSVYLPAPLGAQAALIDSDPARFFRPPYVGGNGWVAVVLDTSPDWDMVASLVGTAYALKAPTPRPDRPRGRATSPRR